MVKKHSKKKRRKKRKQSMCQDYSYGLKIEAASELFIFHLAQDRQR